MTAPNELLQYQAVSDRKLRQSPDDAGDFHAHVRDAAECGDHVASGVEPGVGIVDDAAHERGKSN